jgi:ACS family hexuronate transporter-like MFS transporter
VIARSSLRWWIAVVLAASAALNYLDRQALPILAETLEKELGLTTAQYSFITATFLFGYTAMTGIAGWLLDRFGTRLVLSVAVVAWSLLSAGHALCQTAGQLVLLRLLLGTAQSANWPAGIKATTEWFPVEERAFAVGIFNSGSSIGSAVSVALVSFVTLEAGWRSAFALTGVLGIFWVAAFLFLYRIRDRQSPLPSECIGRKLVSVRPLSLWQVLSMRASWGCFVARIFIDPVTYFFIFWIPKYMQSAWGFRLEDVGRCLWAPYAALAIGTVLGGEVPRRLVRRGWTVNRARKSAMLAASLVALFCCVLIAESHSVFWVVVLLGVFMFFHGFWGNIAIPAEVFPSRVVGTVAGLGGLLGGVAGICSQPLIAWVLVKFSFAPIFFSAGVMYLLAFFCLSILIPNLGEETGCCGA